MRTQKCSVSHSTAIGLHFAKPNKQDYRASSYRFLSVRTVPSGRPMKSSFVWNRIFYCVLFNRKIRKVFLDFCKRDKQQFRFTTYCHSIGLRINAWRKFTCKNLYVLEFSLLCNPCQYYQDRSLLYIGESGGQCPVLANTRVTLLNENVWQRTKNINITKRDWTSPKIEWTRPIESTSFTPTCGHTY